jgi:hypothetical protein
MSISTITNRATNPKAASAATGYAAVPGTGGTATGVRNAAAGYTGAPGFFRTSWTVATTALSGGGSYTQTGLAAATQYSHLLAVRASKTQTVKLAAQYQNASAVNVGAAVSGPAVALVANTWTLIKVEGATSGAAVDRVVLTAAATTGGTFWANTDTFDIGFVTIITGPTAASPFDGSNVNAASIIYAWTGTADASTSTAKLYTPALALVGKATFDPCPRVEITLTDLTPTTNTVTIWRTADGKRQAVRGVRQRGVVSADFFTDYETPLGRAVSYEVEVTSGVNAQAPSSPATVTLNTASGCIQDPLNPSSAIPVHGTRGPNGEANLRGQAMKTFEYKADMSILPVLGSPDPVALIGQRMAASGVDMSLATRAAQEAADLRNLLQQAPLVLVRPLPVWAAALPGLCYLASGTPVEQPVDEAWGGSLIWWELVGSLVAAPTMNVLVPLWTYGDVKALWGTYQQAQTALSGKSYLEVLKSPSGV